MPNHVINEIIIHGAKLEAVREHLFDKDGRLSFGVLLPLPINFWAGSVGSEHEKAFPGNHLAAARATWGTKWDAYGNLTADETDSGVVIRFESAWNHPRGWVCALFNTLMCDMTASWISEGGAARIEKYIAADKHGEMRWTEEKIEDGSPEHRRLHKLLWGVEEFAPEDADDDAASDTPPTQE